jgi:hypothetical protein
MNETIQPLLEQLAAEGLSPQEVIVAYTQMAEHAKLGASLAQFPTAILPQEQVASIAAEWLLSFAVYCDGPEDSADYAGAAILARNAITEIAEEGVSGERLVALVRATGLLYRRVMKSAPHLRTA